VSGTAPPALLGTLSSRLINIFESDLLQALPLYVLMGALLNRLTWRPRCSAPCCDYCRPDRAPQWSRGSGLVRYSRP
jgi:hypothetical protein